MLSDTRTIEACYQTPLFSVPEYQVGLPVGLRETRERDVQPAPEGEHSIMCPRGRTGRVTAALGRQAVFVVHGV